MPSRALTVSAAPMSTAVAAWAGEAGSASVAALPSRTEAAAPAARRRDRTKESRGVRRKSPSCIGCIAGILSWFSSGPGDAPLAVLLGGTHDVDERRGDEG